jgi:hypothetical protein
MTKNKAITTRFLGRAATWFPILLIFVSSAPPCCAFFQRGPPLLAGCFRPRARIETSRNRAIATTCTASSDGEVVEEAWEGMMFGPHRVDGDQIFYKSDSGKTAAFVNLRYVCSPAITPPRDAGATEGKPFKRKHRDGWRRRGTIDWLIG